MRYNANSFRSTKSLRDFLQYQRARSLLTLRLAITYSLLVLFGVNVLSVLSIIFLVGFGKIHLSEKLIFVLIAETVAQAATVFLTTIKFIFSK